MQSSSTIVHKLYSPAGIAIRQLYEQYGSVIYGIILQYEPEKTKAGYLLINVFEKANALLPAYNPSRQRLFTWLYQLLVLRLQPDYPAIAGTAKKVNDNRTVAGMQVEQKVI